MTTQAATYAEVKTLVDQIRSESERIMREDRAAMEQRVQQLVQEANEKANAARWNQFKVVAAAAAGGPVPTAAALLGLAKTVMATQASVNDVNNRRTELFNSAANEDGIVNSLLDDVDTLFAEYAAGRQTYEIFLNKARDWEKIKASVDTLHGEMEEHATKAAWTSLGGSSAAYEEKVPAQKAALMELSQVAKNSATVSVGVATLQAAIYGATQASTAAVVGTLGECTASRAANNARDNIFYQGTMTAKESLQNLTTWMRFTSPISWFMGGFTLSADLQRTLTSVTVLNGGWPGRTDAPQGGQGSVPSDGTAVAEVDQREFVLSETQGETGGHLTW